MAVFGLAFAILLFGASCATNDPSSHPHRVGEVAPSPVRNGLALRLSHVDGPSFSLGGPVRFEVEMQNTSDRSIRVPQEPIVTLVWVYPSGRRDNTMRQELGRVFMDETNIRRLGPGESLQVSVEVSTRYFEGTGIMEFAAILTIPPTSAPLPGVAVSGRYVSNRIGLEARRL